jgi:hypothetical protein
MKVKINWLGIAAIVAGYQLWGWWGVVFALGVMPYNRGGR